MEAVHKSTEWKSDKLAPHTAFETAYEESKLEATRDPVTKIPPNDLVYEKRRPPKSAIPLPDTHALSKAIKDMVEYFSSDLHVLERKNRSLSEYPKREGDFSKYEHIHYEIDHKGGSKDHISGKPAIKDIFGTNGQTSAISAGDAAETDTLLDQAKLNPAERVDYRIIGQDTRQDFTGVFRPRMTDVFSIFEATNVDLFQSTEKRKRFSVQVSEVEWQSPAENKCKLKAEWSLYDLSTRSKLSETFHFEISGNKNGSACYFDVAKPSPEVVLVMRLEKAFEGDVNAWVDAYAKAKPSDATAVGSYRQALGWYVFYPFEGNRAQNAMGNFEMQSEWFNRHEDSKASEEDILNACIAARSIKGSTKKGKIVPVRVTLNAEELNPDERVVTLEEFSNSGFNAQLSVRHHLYCYLKNLNISKGNSSWKNVAVKIQLAKNDVRGDDNSRFVDAIIDGQGKKTTEYLSAINYHNRSPDFYDEAKIALPLPVDAKHHLLLTFYHISYTHRREDSVIGYAAIPLLSKEGSFIKDGNYELQIFPSLGTNYLLGAAPDMSGKKFDNSKLTVNLKLKLSSSFYVQDGRLNTFFDACRKSTEDGLRAVDDILAVDPVTLASFWPLIGNEMLNLLVSPSMTASTAKKVITGIVSVLTAIHGDALRRHPIVVDFVQNRFCPRSDAKSRPLHNELTKHFLAVLQDMNQASKDAVRHTWFFLNLIFKSAGVKTYTHSSGQIPITGRDRFFDPAFQTDLDVLMRHLSQEVYHYAKSGFNLAKDINHNLAEFYLDMLSCYKIDFVFDWTVRHVQGFSNETATNVNLKFEFLQTFCAYENAVALSLPLRGALMPDRSVSFHQNYARFFFPYILLQQINQSVRLTNEDMRMRGFTTLLRLLEKMECDPRYTSNDARQQVFTMFLPLLICAADNSVKIKNHHTVQDKTAMTQSEKRVFLSCVAFVLRYADNRLILAWLERESTIRLGPFMEVLSLMPETFQYIGKTKFLDNVAKGLSLSPKVHSDSAKKYIENAYRMATSGSANLREARGTLRQQMAVAKSTIKTSSNTFNSAAEVMASQMPDEGLHELKMAIYQSYEITVQLISFLYPFCERLRLLDAKNRMNLKEFEGMFDVTRAILMSPFSDLTAPFVLKFCARTFTSFFKILLKGNKYSSELVAGLMPFLGSHFPAVRNLAAEFIYVMMRLNLYEKKNNIGKIRMQMTVTLSNYEPKDPVHLKLGLLMVEMFSQRDTIDVPKLKALVSDCIATLITILKNNVRLKRFTLDPEMQEDMIYRLVQSYSTTPDLRLAMLETLSHAHSNRGQFAEAALATLQSAALVADYLKFKGLHPTGSTSFRNTSINIEEFNFSKENNPEEEGLCQTPTFTEQGLIDLLNTSINLFRKGQLQETAVQVYKLLVPIYEKSRNYEALVKTYDGMRECYETAISTGAKRVLGTFFRVSYFGAKLGDLNEHHFIYKERTVTQLSEIVQRLSEPLKTKYGASFELINDSARLDPAKLDKNKVYLAVVHVEPYFTAAELPERSTYYDKMNNVSRFVFDMPFTLSGKPHGEVDQQHKRKVILTSEKCFPYIKKRVPVISTHEIVLTPIEVSCEAMADRCDKLRAIVDAKPLNLKNLQLLLQGIVRAQVNKGPLEIAQVFLDPENPKFKTYPVERIQELRGHFRTMLELCQRALKLSKQHAQADQDEYNEDLESGYGILKLKLDNLMYDVPNSPLAESMSGSIAGSLAGSDPFANGLLK